MRDWLPDVAPVLSTILLQISAIFLYSASFRLEYLVVVLYKTTEFVSTDKEYINAVWKELTNGDKDMFLELIETSRNKITKGFLQIFDSHDENEVVFKSPFVAFKNSSEQGYQSARNLIKKATLKKTWMLWR